MRHYEKPTIERVKLLVKEDIALTRTTIGGVNEIHSGKSVTTYKSTDKSANLSYVYSDPADSGEGEVNN